VAARRRSRVRIYIIVGIVFRVAGMAFKVWRLALPHVDAGRSYEGARPPIPGFFAVATQDAAHIGLFTRVMISPHRRAASDSAR